jgi:diphthine synthase
MSELLVNNGCGGRQAPEKRYLPIAAFLFSVQMGRFIFIGLGLSDDRSITIEAIDACRKCDVLFAEQYTSKISPGSIERLEKMIGKEIRTLGRTDVEEGAPLKFAKDRVVGFLVPGDPMTATTHVDLRIRANDLGLETGIVHGTSAMVAVPGILGLQHYKFGRTVTIPFSQKGFEPTSPFEQLENNLKQGLHTLALLDIQSAEDRYMTANEGLKWLVETSAALRSQAITKDALACVVARAGSHDCIARANRISELIKYDFGKPLHTIVLPGKLHFQEEEALARFAAAPRELFSADV